jgi:hypothetical protein
MFKFRSIKSTISDKLLLPNLIIAGVNKGGTTSLFSYLSRHSEICPFAKKELCYFLPLTYGEKMLPIEEYSQYFQQQYDGQKYIMESTPGYFYGRKLIPQAIKNDLGNIKILIILREPISRLFSFYRFQKSMLKLDQNITFNEYINQWEQMPITEAIKRENN